MVHPLPVQRVMAIAVLAEQLGGKDRVQHLGFLQAQDVRLLLGDQLLDQVRPGAHRIDVPGCDLQAFAHCTPLSPFAPI